MMEVLVVAAHDAALVDHLRGVVYDAVQASGTGVEITMGLPDTPEQRLSEQQLLLWRDQRCPSSLPAYLTSDPALPQRLLPSASIDSLASPNNPNSEGEPTAGGAAAAATALLKRIHKRDRKIKALTSTIEELKTQLAEALARATFVEHEQEQFFEDVQHMKAAYDTLHSSHQKLLWEYLPSKDPDLQAIPRLTRDLDESESRVGSYALADVLGYGQYATVFAAEGPHHEQLAVKAIDKEKLLDLVTLHRVNSEIASLQDPHLRHPGILALRDVFHTTRHIFLVTERGGKDLFEYFGPREQGVPEETVKALMQRVALAVEVLHRHHYCHRDLKPENILYDPATTSLAHAVKLVDFGLCTRTASAHDAMLHDFCGSPGFFAPEILLSAQYDGQKADVWSLGCILFELVVGNDQFASMWMTMYELETLRDHDKFKALVHSSLEAVRAFCHGLSWTYSPTLRALMLSLLTESPRERPTVSQMLDHAWFRDAAHPPTLRSARTSTALSSSRGSISKPSILPSSASFCESYVPVDTPPLGVVGRRPASAEHDPMMDHGSPHVSVLLAAAPSPAEPLSPSSPTKPAQSATHQIQKVSLPSLSPEKPTGARSPDKTFAKRAVATTTTNSTTTMMPPTSHHTSGSHTPPTRSSSRYDDDDGSHS